MLDILFYIYAGDIGDLCGSEVVAEEADCDGLELPWIWNITWDDGIVIFWAFFFFDADV